MISLGLQKRIEWYPNSTPKVLSSRHWYLCEMWETISLVASFFFSFSIAHCKNLERGPPGHYIVHRIVHRIIPCLHLPAGAFRLYHYFRAPELLHRLTEKIFRSKQGFCRVAAMGLAWLNKLDRNWWNVSSGYFIIILGKMSVSGLRLI